MAAQPGDTRGFHARRSRADDHNFPGFAGGKEGGVSLLSHICVYGTLHPQPQIHHAHAAIHAGRASSHLLKLSLESLPDELRVCDQRSPEGHHVRFSFADDAIGQSRIVDAAYGYYRDAHTFLQALSQVNQGSLREGHGQPGPLAGFRAPAGDIQEIDPGLFERLWSPKGAHDLPNGVALVYDRIQDHRHVLKVHDIHMVPYSGLDLLEPDACYPFRRIDPDMVLVGKLSDCPTASSEGRETISFEFKRWMELTSPQR